jgi:hypothetical protein
MYSEKYTAGSTSLQKVCKLLPAYTAPHPKYNPTLYFKIFEQFFSETGTSLKICLKTCKEDSKVKTLFN